MWAFAILIAFGVFGATLSSPVVDPKIVNGTDAKQGEFPFMVSLRKNNGQHFCGGSLVSDQWVLTAGHCVRYDPIDVYYDDISIDHVSNFTNSAKFVNVIKQVRHPNFTELPGYYDFYIRNDVALFKLAQKVNLTDTVRPIYVPKQDEAVPINQTATLIGWGFTDAQSKQPNILQKVNLTIFDYPYCDKYNSIHNFSNTQNLCAGNIDNTKGQCTFDSGGPLFIGNVQWGIVSWSLKPCISAPGVFTVTSVFADWINSVIGN